MRDETGDLRPEIMKKDEQSEMDLIPAALDTPEFREAWECWCEWKSTQKGGWTARMRGMALRRLERWGCAAAVAALEHSTGCFRGIYPDPAFRGKSASASGHTEKPLSMWEINQRLEAVDNELESSDLAYASPNAEKEKKRRHRRSVLIEERKRLRGLKLGV